MITILEKIVETKRIDLIQHKIEFPQSEFDLDSKRSQVSFYEKLSIKGRAHLILECKKASPSKGVIRNNFDPAKIALVYNEFASAISVLTDEPYFQGSFEYLEQVRQVSDLPILCKDFIIDEYQIYRARNSGADAVLLILEVLDDEAYIELAKVAHHLGMGVLTEVCHEEQAKRARDLEAKIIGVNNRNLEDFSIDLNRVDKLAPIFDLSKTVLISESGIYNHLQIKEKKGVVDGFLIGSSVMQEDNIKNEIQALVFGKNKLCGVMNQEIVDCAQENGFYYIGYNFVPSSKRFITIDLASTLQTNIKTVGVFQNASIPYILKHTQLLKLDAVQLHGDEDNEFIENLKDSLASDTKIFKAIIIDQINDNYSKLIDLFIIDSKNKTGFGGTGEVFDWSKITGIPKNKILIAGGIGIDNLPKAMAQECLGLDLNSKLEDEKGNKSIALIKEASLIIKGKIS